MVIGIEMVAGVRPAMVIETETKMEREVGRAVAVPVGVEVGAGVERVAGTETETPENIVTGEVGADS
jgi:hypothetical protein